jgi:hypothetical protein
MPRDAAAREASSGRAPHLAAADATVADELAADEARRRIREHGIVPIATDDRIRALLVPGECLVAVRRGVALERRIGARDGDDGLCGDLYLTTGRMLLLGSWPVEFRLADISEVVVVGDGLRLIVGKRGVGIRVCDPRVLRVEIAAARAAARATTAAEAAVPPRR